MAEDLSRLIGREISVAMLDAFTAESKPHRFPAEMLSAWVEVTGSRRVLELLCAEVRLSVATEEDREFADLGRSSLKHEKLQRKLWERI